MGHRFQASHSTSPSLHHREAGLADLMVGYVKQSIVIKMAVQAVRLPTNTNKALCTTFETDNKSCSRWERKMGNEKVRDDFGVFQFFIFFRTSILLTHLDDSLDLIVYVLL